MPEMPGNRASAYRTICSAVGRRDDSSLKTGLPILRQKCTQSNREVKSWIRNQKGAEGEISSTTKAWVLPKNKKMSQAEDDMDFRWF